MRVHTDTKNLPALYNILCAEAEYYRALKISVFQPTIEVIVKEKKQTAELEKAL